MVDHGKSPINSKQYLEYNKLVKGETGKMTIVFEEPVYGFTVNSLTGKHATFANLETSDNGTTWTVDIIPESGYFGEVIVIIDTNGARGIHTNNVIAGYRKDFIINQPDTTAPDSDTTQISIDAVTSDNIINKKEKADGVKISGKVKGEFNEGDVVSIQFNQHTLTTRLNKAGEYQISVDKNKIPTDGQYTIFASVAASDKAGNVNKDGSIKNQANYTVDTTVQGKLQLQEFTDSANPYIKGSNQDFISNDNTFNLSIANGEKNSTTTFQQNINGSWQNVDAKQQNLADGTYQFRAIISDVAGNSKITNEITVEIDTTADANPTDVIYKNNTVSGKATAGSYAIVYDKNGEVLGKSKVKADGTFSVEISGGQNTAYHVASMDTAGNLSGKTLAERPINHHKVYTAASGVDENSHLLGYKNVLTSDADDWIEIGNGAKDCWTCGTQGNIWNAWPHTGWAVLDTGTGNDRIDTGVGGGSGSMFAYTGIHMGEGNDTLNLKGAMVNNAFVEMGAGDDIATIGGFMGTFTSIDMGDGNDTLTLNGPLLAFSNVDLGTGDDTLSINGHIAHGAFIHAGEGDDTVTYTGKTIDGFIHGGEGQDTLVLDYSADDSLVSGFWAWQHITNASTQDFAGFETVKLAGKNALDVRYKDLLADNERDGALFIQGNETSKVDLGASDWNSDTGENLHDVCGGKWMATGNKTVDGIDYTVYHHSMAGSDLSNDVYIQSGIIVI